MTVTIAGRSVAIGAIVAVVGGLLAVIGVFLAWAQLSIGAGMAQFLAGQSNGIGLDQNAGWAALVVGVLAIVLAVAWALEVKIPSVNLLVLVAGVLVLVVVALTYFTSLLSPNSLKDAINAANQAIDEAKAAGGDTSGTSAGLGMGFLLEIVAGIVVIVGAGLGLMKKPA
jgi:hypothetical protein